MVSLFKERFSVLYVSKHTHIWANTCIYAQIHAYMRKYTNICANTRINEQNIRAYMRKYTQICANTRRYAQIHAYMRKYTHICANTRIYAQIHAYMRKYTHICANTRIYALNIHAYMRIMYMKLLAALHKHKDIKFVFMQIYMVGLLAIHIRIIFNWDSPRKILFFIYLLFTDFFGGKFHSTELVQDIFQLYIMYIHPILCFRLHTISSKINGTP